MKETQRLIIVLGDDSLINSITVRQTIAGFHACTIIKTLSDEILDNVFHFNKNAVLFAQSLELSFTKYNPVVVRLTQNVSNTDLDVLSVNRIIEDFPKILEEKNIDVGDHASHDSTGMVCQNPQNCLLCKIYARKTTELEHIVYETEHFFIVPGTGAFFNGYFMIVPKRHVMSFAVLSEEERLEFFDLLNDIRPILEAIYGKKVFAFECGSGKTGEGKHETSIVHAHFHLAPTDMPVLKEVQKSGLHPALIQKNDLGQYGDYPYMLYVDQEDNWFICSNPQDYYPRQHPRQVLANYMGCYDIYNWRTHPFRERMDVIANEFREFCKTNYPLFPEWIQSSIRFND